MKKFNPKHRLKSLITTKRGLTGKVVEIVLFRREESVGYGVKDGRGRVFYVGEDEVL